ncbi:MAG: ribosomal protein large subunit ribosomal protein [Parcubacteria group bacterium]|nr:ribosomal protein large subunit ribosomal protein [Parcubacteria group bacterium]
MASTGTHRPPAKARKEEAKKQIRASIDTYNQAPRKVRLVTDMIKGKRVADAIAALSFLPKRASLPIKKLIESAAANAKQKGEDVDMLRVEDIRVDSAGMLVRFMPRAMGRAAPIRKRRSQVVITLGIDPKAVAKAAKA